MKDETTAALTLMEPKPTLVVPEIDTTDLELLGKVTPLYEALVDSVAPTDRLETLEELATVYFHISSRFAAKGWEFLLLIEREGLWKLVKDAEGNSQWTNFYDYAQHFFEGIKSMRRRTIASRVSMAKTLMIELGLDPADAGMLLDDKPSITAKALEAAQFDEFSGKFVGIDPDVRANMLQELGVRDPQISDKKLMQDYLGHIASAEHDEASGLVKRVQDNFSIWLSYDSTAGEIILNGHGRVPGEKTIQMFRVPFVLKHPSKRVPKQARSFLMTRLRPAFKGKPNSE